MWRRSIQVRFQKELERQVVTTVLILQPPMCFGGWLFGIGTGISLLYLPAASIGMYRIILDMLFSWMWVLSDWHS